MKNRDEIEDLFAASFGNFEETPPEEVKVQLDAKLFPTGTIIHKKSNWKWLIILFPIAIISVFALYFSKRNSNENSELISTQSKTQSALSLTHKKANHQTQMQSSVVKLKEYDSNKINSIVDSNIKTEDTSNQKNKNNLTQVKKTNAEQFSKAKNNLKKSKITTISARKGKEILASKTKNRNQKNGLKSIKIESQKLVTKVKEKSQIDLIDMKSEKINSTNLLTEKQANSKIKATDTSLSKFQTKENQSIEQDNSRIETLNLKIEDSLNKNADSITMSRDHKKETVDSSKLKKENDLKQEIIASKEENKKPSTKWNIALYGGIVNGINILNPTNTQLVEKISTNFSLEATYQFHSKFAVSAGLGFDHRSESLNKNFNQIDSIISGTNVQYIIDSNNVIIDSIVIIDYAFNTVNSSEKQLITYSTFSIPLYLNYTVFEKNKWSGAIGAGIKLNYFKTIVNSSISEFQNPTLSNFGLQVQLRPQLNYNWSKFGIGIYSTITFDVKQAAEWADFTRKRVASGTGIIFKYKF